MYFYLVSLYAWFIVGDVTMVVASALMMVFLLWRHQSNIQRLLAGQEG
jgi:glycerol-3-phosphate acyltransferase PlsY